ncbi:hypothetical protein OROGR_026104 [Orobanche gracilis]
MEEDLRMILGTPPDSDTFMDTVLDFDYVDELLPEGCRLEANRSEFSQFDSSTAIPPFGPSFPWPVLEPHNTSSSFGWPESYEKSQSHVEESISNPMARPEDDLLESGRRWIGPRSSLSVTDRLIRAVGYIKNRWREEDVLIQVWVPVTRGGKRVLTTHDQLFSIDLNCTRLTNYRDISVTYQFVADEDSKESVGLPARVFMNRVPEWTPDVRFFTWDEYQRVGHAKQFDVRGTLAVPVLEHGSRSCLGVIEVVLTTQKIHYRPELDSVCEALEAVNLKSADISSTRNFKPSDLSYQAALPEIRDVLRSICEKYGLPLAQTWIPCTIQGKGGYWHSDDDNLKDCASLVESACHIGDPRAQGLHEACAEYHPLRGQGIVGQAFCTNQPCFSPDVSTCSKTEYPLSHHARMLGLKAAVAIRLRDVGTGSADVVLEFFLPMNHAGPEEQKGMLTLLSTTVQDACRTLRVITNQELREEESSPVITNIGEEVEDADFLQRSHSNQVNYREISGAVSMFQNGKSLETSAQASEIRLGQQLDGSSLYTDRTKEKRRVKAEKTIALEVLRQHFSGSLKDAAKNLSGEHKIIHHHTHLATTHPTPVYVCPTTLKRICRQHGIQRWPSRKIKKVGSSLQKIQCVIDSVQGASGVLQINSFYPNFSELETANHFSNSKSSDDLKRSDAHPESSTLRPLPLSPSSSCGQSLSSSHCCSTEARTNAHSLLNVANCEDQTLKDVRDSNQTMKRTKSDAGLHFSDDGRKLIPRSQSHTSFCGPNKPRTLQPAAEEDKSRGIDYPRIKASYGEDTVRFRMQNNWDYDDLLREICRRFGVDDASDYRLKYLDDDAEWVLLTCDEDLEECIDVCRSSGTHTIKISLLRNSQSQV